MPAMKGGDYVQGNFDGSCGQSGIWLASRAGAEKRIQKIMRRILSNEAVR